MRRRAMSKEIDELKAEIAQLRAEVERANPPAPPKFEVGERGPTTEQIAMSRASLSREAMRKMVEAVPDGEVRGILRDGRATQNLAPLADANARPRVAQENRSGWANEVPLSPPPGINHCDRLMDHQDAKDRAALIMEEGRRLTSSKK
jgi:hypothetical protein